jgi:protein SCO1
MAASDTEARPEEAQWWRRFWAIALGALIPLAGIGGFVLGDAVRAPGGAALPVLGTAPPWRMINQLGATVNSVSLSGKVQLVTFLFPYCTTFCPLIAAHLANFEALDLAPARLEDKVAIVSFNLDPAATGPKEMRAFMRQYGWDPKDTHWQFLTGAPDAMRAVVTHGFSVWYQRVSLADEAKEEAGGMRVVQPEVENKLAQSAHADYDIVHNDVLDVIDTKGRIRKIYGEADTVGTADLLEIVERLLKHPA